MNYLHFKYNINTLNNQTYQYGSDKNGNIISVSFQGSLYLYDDCNIKIGYAQFIDNGVSNEPTTDVDNLPQLYNETGTYFVTDIGSITYNISFVADNKYFADPISVPTVISTSGEYYNKVNQIAINLYPNGDRDVWITLL